MLESAEVEAYLEEGNRDYVSSVRIRTSDSAILVYVFSDRVAAKAEGGFTSIRQLNNLKKHIIKQFSSPVEIAFIQSDSHQALEAGFSQLLNLRFDNKIRSLYVSFIEKDLVDTWIEAAGLPKSKVDSVSNYYQEILAGAKIRSRNIEWFNLPSEEPSIPVVLRKLKELQPVSVDVLRDALVKDYGGVDAKWVKSMMDQLRKKDLILWQKPGNYVLTAKALGVIPAGTTRVSSDVSRALALGRRKW